MWSFVNFSFIISCTSLYIYLDGISPAISCVHSQSRYSLSLFFFFFLSYLCSYYLEKISPLENFLNSPLKYLFGFWLLCQVSSKSLLRGFVKNLMVIQNISVKTSLHICWPLLNMLVKKVSPLKSNLWWQFLNSLQYDVSSHAILTKVPINLLGKNMSSNSLHFPQNGF